MIERFRPTGAIQSLFALCLLLLISTSGCVSHHSERMTDVNPSGWESTDSAQVIYTNRTDTTSFRDIFILVRTNSKFTGDQLAVVITIRTPSGDSLQEGFTLNTIQPTSTLAKHKEYSTLYRTSVLLPRVGDYTFTIAPSSQSVVGVTGVGIKVDKSEK